MSATRWPIGVDVGITPPLDPRDDDPNDRVSHPDRRTLRAAQDRSLLAPRFGFRHSRAPRRVHRRARQGTSPPFRDRPRGRARRRRRTRGSRRAAIRPIPIPIPPRGESAAPLDHAGPRAARATPGSSVSAHRRLRRGDPPGRRGIDRLRADVPNAARRRLLGSQANGRHLPRGHRSRGRSRRIAGQDHA